MSSPSSWKPCTGGFINPLDTVLAELQEQFDSFKPGTTEQPLEGTVEWFQLRVTALGLSYLRQVKLLAVEHRPDACERVYRAFSGEAKGHARLNKQIPGALATGASPHILGAVTADVPRDPTK